MDSSTLLKALLQQSAELEHWESVDDAWLNRWTAAVVLGVALELGLIAWEYREDLRLFRRGTIHSPERPSLKKLLFELVACGLVVGGVAGELFVTRSVSEIGTNLRIISHRRVGIAEEDAGDARKEAAKSDLARVQLEKSLQWRTLSQKQQSAICSVISPAMAEKSGVVTLGEHDQESLRYAREFAGALRHCASPNTPIPATPSVGGFGEWPSPMRFGVWIGYRERDNNIVATNLAARKRAAFSLRSILEKSGVKISGVSSLAYTASSLEIYVGPLEPPTPNGIVSVPFE